MRFENTVHLIIALTVVYITHTGFCMALTSNSLPDPCMGINVSFLSVKIWENGHVVAPVGSVMCVFETYDRAAAHVFFQLSCGVSGSDYHGGQVTVFLLL